MGRVALCKNPGCDRLPVYSGWCWECGQERQLQHAPLGFIVWNAPDID